jgi:hypothetical protein
LISIQRRVTRPLGYARRSCFRRAVRRGLRGLQIGF